MTAPDRAATFVNGLQRLARVGERAAKAMDGLRTTLLRWRGGARTVWGRGGNARDRRRARRAVRS